MYTLPCTLSHTTYTIVPLCTPYRTLYCTLLYTMYTDIHFTVHYRTLCILRGGGGGGEVYRKVYVVYVV